MRHLSQQFEGAWPYLQLNGRLGIDDPLDRRVVDAYWVGNSRLNQVSTRAIGDSMEERFRFRAGPGIDALTDSVVAGGVPHHSFVVFCIYPWTGLLSDGQRLSRR